MTMESELAWEVTCAEVRAELAKADSPLRLIDCREATEFETGSITGAVWIPMSEFPTRLTTAPVTNEEPIVVFCHLGFRSLQVVQWLRQQGYRRAQSMQGGMEQWLAETRAELPPE